VSVEGACCRELRVENGRLAAEAERLRVENERLTAELARIRGLLEKARRAGKRQAAPFSKGPPKESPRRPGRKPGAAYGKRGHRRPPDRVDEVIEAPLPLTCPGCGGHVCADGVEHQFQTELPPVRPLAIRFDVAVGHCVDCMQRVQGRHARQTSDALGAAASQLGPNAVALAAQLNKAFGLSYGKIQRLYHDLFDIDVTRGGLSQAIARLGRAARPTYDAMRAWIRKAPVVSPDETGWKVAAHLQWLWVFATPTLTVYSIQAGRGFPEAASILGEDFAGTLARDGWGPYRSFGSATHQTCLDHLLRRIKQNLETARRGAARVPRAVQRILHAALDVRDRRDSDRITPHGLAVARGKLVARMDRLLRWKPTDDENRKLLKHLGKERDALFTFLRNPAVPATNHWAERGLRPAVVTRKIWGGNRTWVGAATQESLASVFRTADQHGIDAISLCVDMLCSPVPIVAIALAPPGVILGPNGLPVTISS
jgi:transposase